MIQYEVIRSPRRKTVVIEVHRDQSVKVRAPLRVSEGEIKRLVKEKYQWIYNQQLRQAELPQKVMPPEFNCGSTHFLYGNPITLNWTPGLYRVRLDGEVLHIPFPDHKSEQHAETMVKAWYRQQAKALFNSRLKHWYTQIDHWQVPQPSLKLRYMKRYWGSCSSRGSITLNIHLLKVPLELIDYVITHEMSHLKEMNHSPRFYAWQASLLPDWKQRRAELRGWEQRVLV